VLTLAAADRGVNSVLLMNDAGGARPETVVEEINRCFQLLYMKTFLWQALNVQLAFACLCVCLQDQWLTCQRNWLYLESIFSAPDIQRQLPAEAKMFTAVDKSYKDIMRKVNKVPLAIRAATQAG
jgi:Dynein heavy chain, N-terminal region 2